ncbi:hypothetical protein QUB30_30060 [Microcoleus sp. BROC3]
MEEFVFGTTEAAPTASSVTPLALETLPMKMEALPPAAKPTTVAGNESARVYFLRLEEIETLT